MYLFRWNTSILLIMEIELTKPKISIVSLVSKNRLIQQKIPIYVTTLAINDYFMGTVYLMFLNLF